MIQFIDTYERLVVENMQKYNIEEYMLEPRILGKEVRGF